MNKENLKLMADYIETVPQDKFDVERFRTGQIKYHECDSVGCVIGHCTVLDKNPLPMDCGRIIFYAWARDFAGLNPNSSEWKYLFSLHWTAVDNTPTGAAKRIRYFIKNGLPKDWYKQILGNAPLSYINQTK